MRRLLVFAMLAVAVGTSTAQQLQIGRVLEATLASDGADSYTFDAAADQFVLLFVDQLSMDVVVSVSGPDGDITTVDGPARGHEIVQFDTETAGSYTIEVTPFEEDEGAYTIELRRLEPLADDPAARVAQLLAPYDSDSSPGAAVGVFQNGETLFSTAVGMANISYGVPFDVDTPTNIGSTSKQFTAMAIQLLAAEGKLSLDDDVRTHLPGLPDFGETVTVRHLLTHTTGYREFLNLHTLAGARLGQGDFIDRHWMIEMVGRQPALQNSPGAEFNYNNTAFALAAQIVEEISGEEFPDYMKAHVFGPLGMSSSFVRLTPETPIPGMSMGYGPGTNGFDEKRDLWGAMGAGGIYASIEDLGKWAENYRNPKVGDAALIEEMMTPFVLTDGDTTAYGLGLFIDDMRGLRRVHHGGADVAHRSMLALFPEIGAAITTQSNHSGFDGSIAMEIAEAFFGEYMEPEEDEEATDSPAAFDPSTYDPEDFDDFAGRYSLDAAPNFILTFTRDDATFYTQATGQQRLEIVPTSDSTFTLTAVEASVTFHRDAQGTVTGLTLDQNGQNHATRIDESTTWSPSADDLAEFAGRYLSEELETFYTLVVEDSSLVVQHRRLDDITLSPGEQDTFSSSAISELSFERDRNGKVLGFYVSNGRTRDVRFARLD